MTPSIGMLKARHLLTAQRAQNRDLVDAVLGEYGVVTAVSGDLVAVRLTRDSAGGGQLFAKAALPVIVGTEGVLLPLVGGSKLFVPMGAAAATGLPLTGGTLTGPLVISVDNAAGFVVQNPTGPTPLLTFNTDSYVLTAQEGLTLIGQNSSDVETWRLDSQTGDFTAKDIIGTSFNSPLIWRESDAWISGGRLTNSTTTYVVAVQVSVTLPAGTWSLSARGHGGMYASAGSQFFYRTFIDTTAGASEFSNCSADDFLPVMNEQLATGVAGSDTFNVGFEFRPVTGGNIINVSTAAIDVLAWRTA